MLHECLLGLNTDIARRAVKRPVMAWVIVRVFDIRTMSSALNMLAHLLGVADRLFDIADQADEILAGIDLDEIVKPKLLGFALGLGPSR